MNRVTNYLVLSMIVFAFQGCSSIQYENIFSKDYSSSYLPFRDVIRFTPTKKEVENAELIVKEQLASLNDDLSNQTGDCPVINESLNNYYRQYFGYYDAKGRKIVWVNFLWKKGFSPRELNEDLVIVFDGCSHYWTIRINLDDRKAFDLVVNDSA